MAECPKCGSYSISGPAYDRVADMLTYHCIGCGYSQQRLPRDRRNTEPDGMSAMDRHAIRKLIAYGKDGTR